MPGVGNLERSFKFTSILFSLLLKLNPDRRDERKGEWEDRPGRDKGREEQDKRGGKERQRDFSGSSEEGGKKSKQGRLQ